MQCFRHAARRALVAPTHAHPTLAPTASRRAYVESTEYSKSGSDAAAAHEPEAFDPKQTSPEEQHDSAAKNNAKPGEDADARNPLNASPANHELSKPPADEGSTRTKESEQGVKKPSGPAKSRG